MATLKIKKRTPPTVLEVLFHKSQCNSEIYPLAAIVLKTIYTLAARNSLSSKSLISGNRITPQAISSTSSLTWNYKSIRNKPQIVPIQKVDTQK